MEKLKFKSLYINFGCKRDFSKTDAYQHKDITKRWFVYYEYLLSTSIQYQNFNFFKCL
ncbi:MAG: hypothetical protein NTW54_02760 [Bacteroidetes bacterium]|nr:hypothetical protein [Bacteroidota bacterium]